ncbi:uncharacterized protein HMPREF1120_02899 [Exophiala dermatitidis NIH/UT8656]|uniref:Metallothionein n=1 Tax=Exophiala dermatitidis (strain ATCC 34100 / CBS 525.76 / NIH/UT8656) TaxID=858893 RepID=H6BRK5_EXODN|nr:uncharacterized protein HMPREF1120_02899 [Exophiala dermatitidis NIH/UT8656]EHY54734.1 hypothetical protein HMPREF1120_02899 [Exophiala dermatitidis NIH/UT8656]
MNRKPTSSSSRRVSPPIRLLHVSGRVNQTMTKPTPILINMRADEDPKWSTATRRRTSNGGRDVFPSKCELEPHATPKVGQRCRAGGCDCQCLCGFEGGCGRGCGCVKTPPRGGCGPKLALEQLNFRFD